jgi:hypothetical protein
MPELDDRRRRVLRDQWRRAVERARLRPLESKAA